MTNAGPSPHLRLAGVVLAAGAGVRAGGPKALRREDSGPQAGRAWVEIAASSLRDAGCDPVVVVLGAAADDAAPLVPAWARAVIAADWADGQSASLRAGIDALAQTEADAALVTLVDLPWQGAREALSVAALADADAPRASLARLVDAEGAPGHPVLIGRDHWARLRDTLHGDEGARRYLAAHPVRTVRVGPGREAGAGHGA